MQKTAWIIGTAFVIVVLIGALVMYAPRLLSKPPDADPPSLPTAIPGHWFQRAMTGEQLDLLRDIWGTYVTVAQLAEELWPDVKTLLPAEALAAWDRVPVLWPGDTPDKWESSQVGPPDGSGTSRRATMFPWGTVERDGLFVRVTVREQEAGIFEFYVGSGALEANTMPVILLPEPGTGVPDKDRHYRVSIYTDEVLKASQSSIYRPPGSRTGARS